MEGKNKVTVLDTGSMLRKVQQHKRIIYSVLGRRIKRAPSTIKKLMTGTSVQCYGLWQLSIALNHNFFSDLAAQLNATTEGKLHQETTELEQLKHDYLRLKEERDYLRKALDVISPNKGWKEKMPKSWDGVGRGIAGQSQIANRPKGAHCFLQ